MTFPKTEQETNSRSLLFCCVQHCPGTKNAQTELGSKSKEPLRATPSFNKGTTSDRDLRMLQLSYLSAAVSATWIWISSYMAGNASKTISENVNKQND